MTINDVIVTGDNGCRHVMVVVHGRLCLSFNALACFFADCGHNKRALIHSMAALPRSTAGNAPQR